MCVMTNGMFNVYISLKLWKMGGNEKLHWGTFFSTRKNLKGLLVQKIAECLAQNVRNF